MIIPEYIIIMTWILAAVIIAADRIQDYDYQIGSARNRLEKLKEEIRELEARELEIKKNGDNL